MTHETRPEEKAISEIIKSYLATQLDSVRKIVVGARTNFLEALQGRADSISLKGQELVKEQIHIKEIEVQVNDVSIDPISAVLGQIKLNHPLDSSIRVVLTEADINRAINSEFVREKIPSIELVVDGETLSLELKPPFKLRLLDDHRMRFSGVLNIHEATTTQQIAFSSVVMPRTDQNPILLENFCCSPGQGKPFPFLITFLKKLEELSSRPYYIFEETKLSVKEFRIQNKNLILQLEAYAEQIPSL